MSAQRQKDFISWLMQRVLSHIASAAAYSINDLWKCDRLMVFATNSPIVSSMYITTTIIIILLPPLKGFWFIKLFLSINWKYIKCFAWGGKYLGAGEGIRYSQW